MLSNFVQELCGEVRNWKKPKWTKVTHTLHTWAVFELYLKAWNRPKRMTRTQHKWDISVKNENMNLGWCRLALVCALLVLCVTANTNRTHTKDQATSVSKSSTDRWVCWREVNTQEHDITWKSLVVYLYLLSYLVDTHVQISRRDKECRTAMAHSWGKLAERGTTERTTIPCLVNCWDGYISRHDVYGLIFFSFSPFYLHLGLCQHFEVLILGYQDMVIGTQLLRHWRELTRELNSKSIFQEFLYLFELLNSNIIWTHS